MVDSILTKLEKKIDAVRQRHRAAEGNLQRIAAEKLELEAAHRIVTQLLDEVAKEGSPGTDSGEEVSRPKLVLKIIEESSVGLRPGEIKTIALEQYGREIPSAVLHAALAYIKKSGRVTNSGGLWSTVPMIESASGESSPETSSSDGQTSAELALHSG